MIQKIEATMDDGSVVVLFPIPAPEAAPEAVTEVKVDNADGSEEEFVPKA